MSQIELIEQSKVEFQTWPLKALGAIVVIALIILI
jgi:hypothetical protein